jgi:hypothetical protein
MVRRLRHLPNQPVTLAEMGLALIRIWNNIPQAFFNNLVGSMRRRCQACINAKHAQWVKDRVKLLAMVTHQHFMVWRVWYILFWTCLESVVYFILDLFGECGIFYFRPVRRVWYILFWTCSESVVYFILDGKVHSIQHYVIKFVGSCKNCSDESGRFGALKSDSTHHFFRNACTKSGSLRFSQFFGC